MAREFKLWRGATLMGTTVGQPGGILWRLRLAASDEEAEELDVVGGKALINGTLLVLSDDGFRSIRCATVARREAARQLADGSVYVSLSEQTEASMRSAKSAKEAAQEAASVAPLLGRRFLVMEAVSEAAATASVSCVLAAPCLCSLLPASTHRPLSHSPARARTGAPISPC